MPAADASNPIEAVRARLDGGRKWLKNDLFDDRGNVCLMGAVQLAESGTHATSFSKIACIPALKAVVLEQYADRVRTDSYWFPIADFNDHPDTTWADVDLVLDKASLRWDEAVRP